MKVYEIMPHTETRDCMASKWIGDRRFYKSVMIVALPIIVQNAITTFVNMLDNIMVGQTGTLPMSAVSISNQLMMVLNLLIIGTVNAASIFSAQYYGKEDYKGMKDCLHFKLYFSLFFVTMGIIIFRVFGDRLLLLYMDESVNSAADIATTLSLAHDYLNIIMIQTIPFAIAVSCGSIIREAGNTVLSMRASIVAVALNFVGNYVLIFGHFGFPKLGVIGAAIATVFARFVEMAIILIGEYRMRDQYPFFHKLFADPLIPGSLLKKIAVKGSPLIANEVLWSIGIAAISQCYSTRGLESIAAINISSTVNTVFMIANMAIGMSISIIIGPKLGAGDFEDAVSTEYKLIGMALFFNLILGIIMFATAPLFPLVYNTTDHVRTLAGIFLRIMACMLPAQALYNACYFTLRAGGRTMMTFMFDSGFTCAINFPIAFMLTRFTSLPIVTIYLIIQLIDIPKATVGSILLKKGVWLNNIINE